jgi:hypothetical protein
MDMVQHKAIRPDLDGSLTAALCKRVAIERVVGGIEENCLAAIAPLSYVIWIAGDHDAAEMRHAYSMRPSRHSRNG